MPSFDIVSEVVWYEVGNAVDQANREIKNRYDFKGSDAQIEQAEAVLTILADDEFYFEDIQGLAYLVLVIRKNC